MNENKIVEYIVEKKTGTKECAIRALIIGTAALISLLTFYFLGVFGLIFTFFAVFFAIYFYRYTMVEYEYLIIGNEFTVDVIFGKTKRKEVAKFDLNRAELITLTDSEAAKRYENATQMLTFDYTSGYDNVAGVKPLLLIVGHGASNARLFIDSDAKVREYFEYMYPSKTKY